MTFALDFGFRNMAVENLAVETLTFSLNFTNMFHPCYAWIFFQCFLIIQNIICKKYRYKE